MILEIFGIAWIGVSGAGPREVWSAARFYAMGLGFETEVEDESNFNAGRREVAAQLSIRDLRHAFGRLDLHDNLPVDDHVQPMMSDGATLEPHRNAHFSCNTMSHLPEHESQRVCIDLLEEAVSQRVIDMEKRANDLSRQTFFRQSQLRGTHIHKIS